MNRYLEKIARSETKEHQSRVIKKLDANSLVAAHSMGSGKTLTALLAAEKAQKEHPDEHVTAIVPASLVSNMKDQITQHGVDIDPERFEVTTYDKAVNDVKRLRDKPHSLVIVDEAHKLRNKDTRRSSEIDKVLKSSRRSLLLSGTPSYNRPEDIAVLVNKAAGTKVLPDTAKDFEEKFIGRRKVNPGFFAKNVLGVQPGEVTYLKNQAELKEALNKYIDHYDAQTTNAADFPTTSHRVIKVNMSPEQKRMYKFLEDDIPAPVRWKIRLGLPLSKKESSDLNAFSTGVRQVSNSIRPYSTNPDAVGPSPKQLKMADSIHEKLHADPNYRGISYSNYIESGLKPLSDELHRRGISNAIYDGSLSAREKDEMVKKYNDGEIKQLLVSSSGAEGLNTKGTKLVQIMEPHFNKSKIDQVIARGVRYKSHEHLPENERHVEVEHYHSVMEPGLIDKVVGQRTKQIDEYLSDVSESKDKLKNDIMALTKVAGNTIPLQLLLKADADKELSGFVHPHVEKTRVPIYDGDSIVGFMTPRKDGEFYRAGAVYVDPDHRGKGLGRQALEKYFQDKKGKAYISETNVPSQSMFRGAGFALDNNARPIIDQDTGDKLFLWKKAAEQNPDNLYLSALKGAVQGVGVEALNRKFKFLPNSSYKMATGVGAGSNVVVDEMFDKVAEEDYVVGAAGGLAGGSLAYANELNALRRSEKAEVLRNIEKNLRADLAFKKGDAERALIGVGRDLERLGYPRHKTSISNSKVAAGTALGIGLGVAANKYLNKAAELHATDVGAPVAGAGVGLGAGYGLHSVITSGLGEEFNDSLKSHADAKKFYSKTLAAVRRARFKDTEKEMQAWQKIDALKEKVLSAKKAVSEVGEQQAKHLAAKNKYLAVGAGLGTLVGAGALMKSAFEVSEGNKSAPVYGAYGIVPGAALGAGTGAFMARGMVGPAKDTVQLAETGRLLHDAHIATKIQELEQAKQKGVGLWEDVGRARDTGNTHELHKARDVAENHHRQIKALEYEVGSLHQARDVNVNKAMAMLQKQKSLRNLVLGTSALTGGILGHSIGYSVGNQRDLLDKYANEIDNREAAIINKVTNPVSWAAKIDLYGNPAVKATALATNLYLREAIK